MSILRKKQNKPGRITNTQSDRAVFSFYQNRVIPKNDSVDAVQQRTKKTKSGLRRLHITTILTLIVIAGCFLYILTIDPNPKIVIVNEHDQATPSLLRSSGAYKQAAEKDLKSSPLSKTKITINTTGLARNIQKLFPEIAGANVSLPLINRRPVYYLQITQPTFLLQKGSNDIYALDEQGRIIMKGDQTLPQSNLVHIEDQTNQDTTVGKQYLPSSQIQFLQNVQAQLADKGVKNISFILPPLANEVYVKLADKPYYIKMTFASDPRLQSGTYLAVKGKLEADKVTPAEYVDVRVEGHAFYK